MAARAAAAAAHASNMGLPLLALLKSLPASDTPSGSAIEEVPSSSDRALPLLLLLLPQVDGRFSGDDVSRGACKAARKEYLSSSLPLPVPPAASTSGGVLLPPALLSIVAAAAAPGGGGGDGAAAAAADVATTVDAPLVPVLSPARWPVLAGAERGAEESSVASFRAFAAAASAPWARSPLPALPPALAAVTPGRPARRREKARRATTAWLRRRCVSAGACPVSWVTLRAWVGVGQMGWVGWVGLGLGLGILAGLLGVSGLGG